MKYLPKLSVRDLLWLIIVVALAVLWWRDRRELVELQVELRRQQQIAKQQHDVEMQYLREILIAQRRLLSK